MKEDTHSAEPLAAAEPSQRVEARLKTRSSSCQEFLFFADGFGRMKDSPMLPDSPNLPSADTRAQTEAR